MANLDTTGSGHFFFDTDSKTVIEAQTESDALLASFMVERKGPNRKGHIFVIDALLNVVRGPGFRMEYIVLRNGKIFSQMRRNSSILDVGTCFSPFTAFYLTKLLQNPAFKPEQVTFPSGVDILLQVAAYRRIVAKKRSLTYNPSMSAVPQIILEQVAGLFADMDRDTLSSREFWPDPDQDLSSHVFFLARKELGVMSLVHRSWTESAQRAMRSIARVVDLEGLYSFLQSPLSGRWTRSLLIGPRSKNGPFVEPTLQRFEAMHLLKTILCIAPKMKLLSIQMQFLPLEPFSLRKEAPTFVRELGRLRSLKTLRLVAMEDSFELLPEVWTALVNMPHLEHLLLHGLVWPYKTPFSTSFSPSTAPPTFSLKSLNLIYNYRKFGLFGDGRFTAGSAFSTWLLQNNDQLNEFSLDAPYSLFFNERDGSCTTFIHVMQPVLPRLKRLSLHLWRYQQEVPPGFSESFARHVLLHGTSLIYLKFNLPLTPTWQSDIALAPYLPASLVELVIYLTDIQRFPNDANAAIDDGNLGSRADRSIGDILRRSPSALKKLRIKRSCSPIEEFGLDLDAYRCEVPESTLFCSQNAIDFKFDV